MDLYFCLYLTENEHYCVESAMREEAGVLGLRFHYYRELKDGHVPMHREVKLDGTRGQVGAFKDWMRAEKYDGHVVQNPHRRPRPEGGP